jgi:hypothetical protein
MNTEQKLKDVIEMSIAQTKERADTTKVLFDELLSYITLSLQEAYNTGYKDGYDCSKLDNGR